MASNITAVPWYDRMLGPDVIACSDVTDDEVKLVSLSSVVTPTTSVVGLYFTPVVTADDDSLTVKLVQLYRRVNDLNGTDAVKTSSTPDKKKFEVVHVVTSAGIDAALEDLEHAFRSIIRDLPWFAVPFQDFSRKGRLCRRYGAKSCTASLVLLEASSGRVVTSSGHQCLRDDPDGVSYPWQPRPAALLLAAGGLIAATASASAASAAAVLNGAVCGLYFSAHWCPPCKAFTPQLVDTYNKVRSRGHKFEIVFVSSDRSLQSFQQYMSTMPWLAVPYEDADRRHELASLYQVQGIPTLVLLDADGRLITDDGRGEVNEDPEGMRFPWLPPPVCVLNARHAARLHHRPAIILFVEGDEREVEFAQSVLLPAALEYRRCLQQGGDAGAGVAGAGDDDLMFLIGCDCDTADLLRDFLGLDDVVPLLTGVDLPAGNLCVLEDDDVSEVSVSAFVNDFLAGRGRRRAITGAGAALSV